ncbi:hypothetical protein [Actinoplanes sp. NPDC026623]|uniref:hypothetical protein n=1 Tax=Actinoplanes sp. NPDC026623 TaxID=3155610 RepID=UPI0034069206
MSSRSGTETPGRGGPAQGARTLDLGDVVQRLADPDRPIRDDLTEDDARRTHGEPLTAFRR